jgi:transposase
MAGHESANARHQHSAEDSGDAYRRVELITGRRRRRDWTPEEKAEIVSASLEPGRTVTEVAARYQVSRGLLWNWRRGARDALAREVAPAFVPLRLAPEPAAVAVAQPELSSPSVGAPVPDLSTPAGSIEVAVGRTRVRMQGVVDSEALRQVLALLATTR